MELGYVTPDIKAHPKHRNAQVKLSPKTVKTVPSGGKMMATVFSDSPRSVKDYFEKGTTLRIITRQTERGNCIKTVDLKVLFNQDQEKNSRIDRSSTAFTISFPKDLCFLGSKFRSGRDFHRLKRSSDS
ncbi:hypothetical protein AMK59_8576 [Oryctes borbonicus]|uniref:Uncharacterized protein n=1 Tax=Oryctes borbonicus TaxID=1629725 RepID=A0A0T6AV35_9SCAR|nr:hypothetical protein AMK59_8576 [Oryctes borbonicus]